MRRKDRELSVDIAREIIDKAEFGVLATVNEDGTPYCIPLSIARDGGQDVIYFHCAREGQKIENMRRNPKVCMSFVGNTAIPDGKFTTLYESAVIYGEATEVLTDEEKIHGLRLICEKYTPDNMADFDNAIGRSLARTAVWKVTIAQITGKGKR